MSSSFFHRLSLGRVVVGSLLAYVIQAKRLSIRQQYGDDTSDGLPALDRLERHGDLGLVAAQQVVAYAGPYPYIDGLLLQVTQRIGSISVRHDPRRAGTSTYTFRRLVRLWLSALKKVRFLSKKLSLWRNRLPPHWKQRTRRV